MTTLLFSALCLVWVTSELWLGGRRRSTDVARSRDHGTLPLLQVTAAFFRRIRVEQRVLSEAFPTQYAAYARETRRLVPFVW